MNNVLIGCDSKTVFLETDTVKAHVVWGKSTWANCISSPDI